MAKSIVIAKSSVSAANGDLLSYQLKLKVVSFSGTTPHVFVHQRQDRLDPQKGNDVFVAIATPEQLHELPVDCPDETSYFRKDSCVLVAMTAEYMDRIFKDVLAELQKLVSDVEILSSDLAFAGTYEITATTMDIIQDVNAHQHFRVPLAALPAGVPVYNPDDTVSVTSPSANLPGWLPTGTEDPAGYAFKYNISRDANLVAGIWPPSQEFLDRYAHLEVNGVNISQVLIKQSGIYWKDNHAGYTPFPRDYNAADKDPANAVRLVLDFITFA